MRRLAPHDAHGLRLAGGRLAAGAAAVEHGRFFPGGVERFVSRHRDGFDLLAGELQHGGHERGVGAVARAQGTEDRLQDVRHLAEEGAGERRRLGRGELQHDAQVVGQLAAVQPQARRLVGLRQVHHGRSAVARVAVHVLEQVQRGAASAVEQFDVARLLLQRVGEGELGGQRLDLAAAGGGQGGFGIEGGDDLRRELAQPRIGIPEEQRERAQGVLDRLHTQAFSTEIGMVRFFVPPNSDTSLVAAPSEQPLPKEKPQPPFMSKVSSAYSRCEDGMTKRSS